MCACVCVCISLSYLIQIDAEGNNYSPHLRLLGFKPLNRLKLHQSIKQASFVYPNEGRPPHGVAGSSAVCNALIVAMSEKQVFALCRYVPRRQVASRLVALVPQVRAARRRDESQLLLCIFWPENRWHSLVLLYKCVWFLVIVWLAEAAQMMIVFKVIAIETENQISVLPWSRSPVHADGGNPRVRPSGVSPRFPFDSIAVLWWVKTTRLDG